MNTVSNYFFKVLLRAEELAHWLRVLVALSEDTNLIPNIHKMVYNHP